MSISTVESGCVLDLLDVVDVFFAPVVFCLAIYRPYDRRVQTSIATWSSQLPQRLHFQINRFWTVLKQNQSIINRYQFGRKDLKRKTFRFVHFSAFVHFFFISVNSFSITFHCKWPKLRHCQIIQTATDLRTTKSFYISKKFPKNSQKIRKKIAKK